jgi:hypothetical protein
MVGCLFSLVVYKLGLMRIVGMDFRREIGAMIWRLEEGDSMRAGLYKDWRIALERN